MLGDWRPPERSALGRRLMWLLTLRASRSGTVLRQDVVNQWLESGVYCLRCQACCVSSPLIRARPGRFQSHCHRVVGSEMGHWRGEWERGGGSAPRGGVGGDGGGRKTTLTASSPHQTDLHHNYVTRMGNDMSHFTACQRRAKLKAFLKRQQL